jgi:IS1 family transposase
LTVQEFVLSLWCKIKTKMNQLPLEKRTQIISLLVEGNSIRATTRITGCSKNTVTKLLVEVGKACQKFHNSQVTGVNAKRVQADEIWSFVYAKEKNVPAEMKGDGTGDVWTWTAIDADTKLIISWLVGDRSADTANMFMIDLAERVTGRIQLTTDALGAYIKAVEGAFGGNVDYARLTKIYGVDYNVTPRGKYSPAVCTGTKTTIENGNPDNGHISTSYVEHQNLTMRMNMRRFTRLTNAFSKKIENHCYAIALHFVYYNFVRIHQTLRVTPAMQAGLTNDLMSIKDIVRLTENNSN